MSQPIGLTCTKCSNAVTDCRLHYTPNGLEIISTALCLSVLFQSFVWRITAVIVGWLSHGSPGVAPSCICFCHQQAGTVKTAINVLLRVSVRTTTRFLYLHFSWRTHCLSSNSARCLVFSKAAAAFREQDVPIIRV